MVMLQSSIDGEVQELWTSIRSGGRVTSSIDGELQELMKSNNDEVVGS